MTVRVVAQSTFPVLGSSLSFFFKFTKRVTCVSPTISLFASLLFVSLDRARENKKPRRFYKLEGKQDGVGKGEHKGFVDFFYATQFSISPVKWLNLRHVSPGSFKLLMKM